MKTKILDINGKEKEIIELPKCFGAKIREDILLKVLEAKKVEQPFAPSPIAGKQSSASGIIIHRRKVWKSGYGRGISRVPRKIMSRKGSQFNWVAAEIPSARGGRRAHPPKILSRMGKPRINKKEMRTALISAISATANENLIIKRYKRIEKAAHLPLVVESKLSSLNTKELISSLKKILGESLFKVALKKKTIRAGKGKLRGRKYKQNAGMLIVAGKEEKFKTRLVDIANAKNLGVVDLAKGGVGRLTLYTETAVRDLGEKLKC